MQSRPSSIPTTKGKIQPSVGCYQTWQTWWRHPASKQGTSSSKQIIHFPFPHSIWDSGCSIPCDSFPCELSIVYCLVVLRLFLASSRWKDFFEVIAALSADTRHGRKGFSSIGFKEEEEPFTRWQVNSSKSLPACSQKERQYRKPAKRSRGIGNARRRRYAMRINDQRG